MHRFTLGGSSLLILCSLACGRSQPSVTKVADPLDPERYRAHIVMLDAMIFSDVSLGAEAQQLLMQSIGGMAQEALMDDEKPATARLLGKEMDSLLGTVQAAGTNVDIQDTPIRGEWNRIRSSLFENAAWFRHGPNDPIGDPGDAPGISADGREFKYVPGANRLLDALGQLFALASDATELGPGASGPAREETTRRIETGLKQVDSLLIQDPPEDAHYRSALNEAKESVRYLREFMAAGADTVEGSPGRAALENMVFHLSEAKDQAEQIGS